MDRELQKLLLIKRPSPIETLRIQEIQKKLALQLSKAGSLPVNEPDARRPSYPKHKKNDSNISLLTTALTANRPRITRYFTPLKPRDSMTFQAFLTRHGIYHRQPATKTNQVIRTRSFSIDLLCYLREPTTKQSDFDDVIAFTTEYNLTHIHIKPGVTYAQALSTTAKQRKFRNFPTGPSPMTPINRPLDDEPEPYKAESLRNENLDLYSTDEPGQSQPLFATDEPNETVEIVDQPPTSSPRKQDNPNDAPKEPLLAIEPEDVLPELRDIPSCQDQTILKQPELTQIEVKLPGRPVTPTIVLTDTVGTATPNPSSPELTLTQEEKPGSPKPFSDHIPFSLFRRLYEHYRSVEGEVFLSEYLEDELGPDVPQIERIEAQSAISERFNDDSSVIDDSKIDFDDDEAEDFQKEIRDKLEPELKKPGAKRVLKQALRSNNSTYDAALNGIRSYSEVSRDDRIETLRENHHKRIAIQELIQTLKD